MGNKEIKKRVEKVLENIRPYLQADGGDIDLVEITDDLVVKVELTGACNACPYSIQTFKAGVEAGLKNSVPEIKKVVAINFENL
ncbi:MAG: NifU family protein [Bacteroidales bacterium]|nr:NifU family protein [Bacteroidales bacterium]MCF8390531.1 NifU family protein [Bacteroidales bacterium]